MALVEKKIYKLLYELNIPAEEAYKTLRSNIRFCGVVNKIKTITITSCVPGEGKTTTAVNLAMSMAKAGIKTLLVDVDLRRPMAEKLLKVNQDIGMTNYITGENSISEVVHSTGIENFYLIPCGPIPPNPAELLSSEMFSDFTKIIKDQYFEIIEGSFDMIIFDTPPLGSVIDAALLAAQTDGTILVIKSKSINCKLAQQVKEQLDKANAYLLGVVLNHVKRKDYQYGYGYGYKHYDYYYTKDKPKKTLFEKLFKR
ncbi:MAG TPA: CpsD/CapB family tyrosine-protein kinase [Clostridiales bacterium]|nr:CpsD/CapB family tyrosine-protein kinase [Clostridiales bacterium]